MKAFSTIAIGAAGLLFTAASFSAVVWDEALDGDLSDSTSDPIISLVDGDNEIVGSISYITNSTTNVGGDLRDRFSFSVGENQILNSVDMTLTAINPLVFNLIGHVLISGEMDTHKFAHSTTRRLSYPIDYGVIEPVPFDVADFNYLDLSDGLFRGVIRVRSAGKYAGGSADITFDYKITANVSTIAAVPIPAAAWLFGSACIGLFGRRMVQCETI